MVKMWPCVKRLPLYKIGLLFAFIFFHLFLFSYFKRFLKSKADASPSIDGSEISNMYCEKINDILRTRDLMKSSRFKLSEFSNSSQLSSSMSNSILGIGINLNSSSTRMELLKSSHVSHLYPTPTPSSHPCSTFPTSFSHCEYKEKSGFQSCPVCYVPFEETITADVTLDKEKNMILKSLDYVTGRHTNERDAKFENLTSQFGGLSTNEDREESYQIKPNMKVHCGFVHSSYPGMDGGFEVSNQDIKDMLRCRGVVVASAIFNDYDEMKQPMHVSTLSEKRVCFYMFMDQMSYDSIVGEDDVNGKLMFKKIGFWNVVVVKRLPYPDSDRNSRIPKLLLHRLFPNAKHSIWADGKIQLTVDPLSILEKFLWRGNHSFAISNHFQRFDIFEESKAIMNRKRKSNPYEIQKQVQFYFDNGVRPYSKRKLPLTSDLPESCVIIRDHSHISNLFSCLWFNEVERFTARDQLSFSFVRDKVLAQVPWKINMFLDCERRNFTSLGAHKLPTLREFEIRKKYENYVKEYAGKRPKTKKNKKMGWKRLFSELKTSN